MAKPFTVPLLGQVSFEDELVYYDGPMLFTVRSENGGRYLAFWALQDKSTSTFWLVPISDSRYRDLRRGDIEVRSALTENEAVLEARRDNESEQYVSGVWRSPQDLSADVLPEAGYRLDYNEAGANGFAEIANVVATRENRPITRLIFDFGPGIHEGPAGVIASAILGAQRTIECIAYSRRKEPKERGVIPIDVRKLTLLALRPVRESSLGIELVAVESDMWGTSIASESLATLVDLLGAGSDQEALKTKFAPLLGRTARSYRFLLQSFQQSGADVVVEAGIPTGGGEIVRTLRKDELQAMVEAMEAVERTKGIEHIFNAKLIGYDTASQRFHFLGVTDDTDYRGKAVGAGAAVAEHAQLSEIYRVHLIETIEFDLITGDEPRSTFELIGMGGPDEPIELLHPLQG